MDTHAQLDLKIPNNFNQLYTRFLAIIERGAEAGMKNVSPEIGELSIACTAKLAAYVKCAKMAEQMSDMGIPVKQIPDEVDNSTNEAINKLEVQMTLEISAL